MPLFEIGLASQGVVLTTTLGAVRDWESDRAGLLPTIRRLLDDHRPAVVEAAARILNGVTSDIVLGRGPYDPILAACVPRLAELTVAKPGAKKKLKTQFAARSALSAFQNIRAHFDPETAALIDRAYAASSDLY